MWKSIAIAVLRFKYVLLFLLALLTAFLGYEASKVKLGYEFAKAIPTDNPKYLAFERFKQTFGDNGGLMVLAVQTDRFFDSAFFNDFVQLQRDLKKVNGIEGILSAPSAVKLVRAEDAEKLQALPLFPDSVLAQAQIDSGKAALLNIPFYRGLLYNLQTQTWMMAVTVDNKLFNTPERSRVIDSVLRLCTDFENKHHIQLHRSGLPLIRTILSDRIKNEMKFFLIGSVVLSALILLLFFRSVSAMLLSLAVVGIGVVWSVGFLQLMGYKISILTALIPPLVVVIGIPNCIYFLNKFHTSYRETGDKREAIITMISKMGIVTLFCNIAAAIGFAVFALTKSAILKEFGAVAGVNILALFFISLLLIPAVLSMLPAPKPRHMKYLESARLQRWLARVERWSLHHQALIFGITAVVLVVSIIGITRLKSVGYIVDDVPKNDKIYTDLKFFEENFGGVMPLEVVVNTKKKYGVTRSLQNLVKIDSLVQFLASKKYIGKPLTLTEGLKFAKQAFFEGDSTFYIMPGENDLLALRPYLSQNTDSTTATTDSAKRKQSFTRLVSSFMDKDRQQARISVTMKDVGSERLPSILDSIQIRAEEIFNRDSIDALTASAAVKAEHKDDSLWSKRKVDVELTGGSVTFLEGTRFIINGLKESILWAFLLIALCMLYLFRSFRILLCSLIPNVIPLIITAGIMGWAGVPLKPSTVLVFSVALGIAIDITIRFLVNYKQQLKGNESNVQKTVIETIYSTGLSIVYTSIVLIAGFVIFCFSGFGGTQALGWLTSVTLVTATVANLVLLPALLLRVFKGRQKS
ncbi:efflux RND transporter permease subunit [Flavisolibacter nicotianae]|uniref:efflux RND transporter permease subunit n=1 Tax=Flavisolibacter nicotianae TaxID=2364882 RepID=UPI000EB5A3BE|nr:MMPL family transporter [Flavisolibacter nicotianae]